MLVCCRKTLRKLTMTWQGRFLVLSLFFLFLLWMVPLMQLLMSEKSFPSLTTSFTKPDGHRWRIKTKVPKLIRELIPVQASATRSDENRKMMQSRMLARTEDMKAACSKHGLDVRGEDQLHRPYPWEYFINWEHNFVWCNVFKSASTSWMYVFNVMAGYPQKFLKKTNQVPLTLARDKYPRPSVTQLEEALNMENVTSLIIARHPLERLVSSYKDKIAGALPGTVHDKLRRRITLKYRNADHLPKDIQGLPSLPKVRNLPVEFIPTFGEFVQHVLDEVEAEHEPDMHWAPVYSFCNPCQVKINTIAKLETLEEDTDYILERIALSKDKLHMKKRNSAPDGKNTSEHTNTFLKQIGEDLYERLIQFYRIDFDIFGYKALNFTSL